MKRLLMMMGVLFLLLGCAAGARAAVTITAQPETQTVPKGGSVTFSVKAKGLGKSAITWHFISPDGSEDITGKKLSARFKGLKVTNPNSVNIRLKKVPEEMHGWTVYCHLGKKDAGLDTEPAMLLIEGMEIPESSPGAAETPDASAEPGEEDPEASEAPGEEEGAEGEEEPEEPPEDGDVPPEDEETPPEGEGEPEASPEDGEGAEAWEDGAEPEPEDEYGGDSGETPEEPEEDGDSPQSGASAAEDDRIRGYDGDYQYLQLGTYYYAKNGDKKPLVWRILQRNGNLVQLITESIIDVKQMLAIDDYNKATKHKFKSQFNTPYEEMDIYRWINGEMASTILEKQDFSAAIIPHKVVEPIKGGPYAAEELAYPDDALMRQNENLTEEEMELYPYGKDLFYIMTYGDMMNENNGFPHTLSGNTVEQEGEVAVPDAGRRKAFATPYAKDKVQYPEWKKYSSKLQITVWAEYGGASPYWTICRRPGYYMIGIVGGNGHLSWRSMASVMIGVRPAAIVDLSRLQVTGGSGSLEKPWIMETAD